jgi:hypothetical protein
MAADLLHVAARLRALEKGQAVPIVSQRQTVIQPHARILTLLSMAGEDTSVHAAAFGGFGEPAQVFVVADPRRRDDQNALLRTLLPLFEEYYAQCRAAGTFPQIWVSSAGALGHLDTLADRLRFTDEPEIRRLGELWTYAGERSPVAGQQSLISASGVLRRHYATGQQESEDEHLLALLTWIDPPPGRDIFAAVAAAEETPMGVKTDPLFDRRTLQPAITDFHSAQSDAARAFHQTRIQHMLEGVIRPIYTAIQRSMALLSQPRWQANAALDELAQQESDEFERFMQARDQNHGLPYHDSAKAGAMKIAARERAVTNVEAGMLRHDRGSRERGVVKGSVLRGQLVDVEEHHLGPRLFEYDLVLSSHQDSLHLRLGDELWLMDGAKLSMEITEIWRRGPFTWVTGRVGKGKQAAKKMSAGPTLDFGPSAPNWPGIGQELGQMSTRLTNEPWTHGDVLPPATPSAHPKPVNLRAAIEDLT